MKSIKLIASAFALSIVLFSCSKDDITDSIKSCSDLTSSCGKKYSACANGSGDAWYEYNGTTYKCASGTDCTDAAKKVVAAAEDDCE